MQAPHGVKKPKHRPDSVSDLVLRLPSAPSWPPRDQPPAKRHLRRSGLHTLTRLSHPRAPHPASVFSVYVSPRTHTCDLRPPRPASGEGQEALLPRYPRKEGACQSPARSGFPASLDASTGQSKCPSPHAQLQREAAGSGVDRAGSR